MDPFDYEFNNLMENIYTVYRLMNRNNEPRQYGTEDILYLNEVHTLQFIGEHPGISLSDLGEYTHRTKGATSMMINKLESKGLIRKDSDPEDVRRYALYLTDKGKKVDAFHQQYDQAHYRDIQACMSDVGTEEFQLVNRVLQALIGYYLEGEREF